MLLDDQPNGMVALQPYISDALEVVRLQFVNAGENLESAPSWPIEFANQHFGDSEKIVGYKDLRVRIAFSDLTLYSLLSVEHSGLSTEVDAEITPEDIREKILTMYPEDQQGALVKNSKMFESLLSRQNEFQPFGEQIAEFQAGERQFSLFKVDDHSREFDAYMCRVQTVTMWYVEAASYTDNTDPRFLHYMLYEKKEEENGAAIKLAGYFTLYRYYAHPDRERARFAHVLLLPPYRKSGVGAKFLSAVFDDICASDRILDTTAETPADAFVFLRDYVDCVRCKPLEEFSAENLRRGFNARLAAFAQKNLKMCKTQTRRIYEILRYYYAQTSQPEDMEAFEASVKKRLALPFARSSRDSTRMRSALDDRELAVVSTNEEERERAVAEGFKDTLEMYEQVLDRLRRFESHLF